MEIYNVGPEELSLDYDLKTLMELFPEVVWIAYWREDTCGYGHGIGKALYKQGEDYYESDLSTCSCYPIHDAFPGAKINIEEWISDNEASRSEVYTNQYQTLLLDKVKELI